LRNKDRLSLYRQYVPLFLLLFSRFNRKRRRMRRRMIKSAKDPSRERRKTPKGGIHDHTSRCKCRNR